MAATIGFDGEDLFVRRRVRAEQHRLHEHQLVRLAGSTSELLTALLWARKRMAGPIVVRSCAIYERPRVFLLRMIRGAMMSNVPPKTVVPVIPKPMSRYFCSV